MAVALLAACGGSPGSTTGPPPPPPPPAATAVSFQDQGNPNFNAILELGGKAFPPFGGPFFAGYIGPTNGWVATCRIVLDTGVARQGLEIVVDRETMNGAGSYVYPIIRDTTVSVSTAAGWVVAVIDTAHVTVIPTATPCH